MPKAAIPFKRNYTAMENAMAILELSEVRSVEKPWQGAFFRLIIWVPATVKGSIAAASRPMHV